METRSAMISSRAMAHLALAAMLGLTGGTAAYAGYPFLAVERVDFASVRVNGKEVHSADDARAVAAEVGAGVLSNKISLQTFGAAKPNDERFPATVSLATLGVRANVDGVAALACHAAKSHSVLPLAVSALLRKAGFGKLREVAVDYTVDEDAARSFLAQLKEFSDQAPLSARLDLEHHMVVPEVRGMYLDVDAGLAAVRAVAHSQQAFTQQAGATSTVVLPFQTFEPRLSSEFVRGVNISTVLSEYETHFSRAGDQSRRGANIDVAAAKLDGLVLSPGELVSFNTVVGERSEQNGFKKSWEIFKGEMVEGIGGGTCQVASTLHAASFFGGLDILERLPHSRPSAYIPMGLDSTVVYPAVDLKLRNPHPFPVIVHAKTGQNTLKIEVLGRERPATVHFGRDVVQTIAYSRKLLEETWLVGKKVIHKQHGIRGYRIRRTRELTYKDGSQKVESTTDYYPPTADIYQVPVGFDASLLPALPVDPEAEATAAAVAASAGAGAVGASAVAGAVLGAGPSSDTQASTAPAAPVSMQPAVGVGAAPAVVSDLEIVDAKGAHAPTTMQAEPSKTMRMSR
jgi:vancomycin resistance protein YoaR